MDDTSDVIPAGDSKDGHASSVRNRKVPLRTKLAFSSGALQEAAVAAAGIATMLFYNQVLGLPAYLCGVAFLIASIVDGISDPLVGAFSDHFRSRWGRRHPLMFASAFPLAVSFYFLYQPIDGLGQTGLFVWFVTFMVLMRLATTFYNIPHDALGAEFTDDYHERTSIFGYNSVIAAGTTVLMAVFVLVVLFPSTPEYSNGLLNEGRYPLLAAFGAVSIFGSIMLCTLGTRDQIPYLHPVSRARLEYRKYFKDLLQLIRNPSYISVCVSWLTIAAAGGIVGMVSTYVYVYEYELSTEQLTIAGFAKLPGILVALPLATYLTHRLDKKRTAIIAALASALLVAWPHVFRLIGWFPSNESPLLLWLLFGPMFLGYMLVPIVAIVVDSQLVDITDDHEYKTGNRAEGVVFSIRTLAIKATSGFGGLIGGFGLEYINFPENAEVGEVAPDVLNGLLLMNGPLYFIVFTIGALFMTMYRLDEKSHHEILAALEERRK